jgi:SNF2 family DNA or RNA helicase
MGRYEWSRHAPYRLRLELSDSGDIWRLEYSLKCFDSGEIFKASDVWFGACAAGNPGAGGYMRRCMLQALGNAGSSFRPIRDSLEEASPSWCVLSSDDASEFLLRGAPDFAGAGIDIVYPSWWKDNASDMLTIRGARREGAGFRWRLAWKGIPLSDEEYKVIVRDRSPLSRIRGGWIFISPDHLEAVLNHIERLPETLSHIEAIRFAIKDPYVDGFDGIPELEATYEALAKGSSPDIFEAPAGMKGELRPYQERGFSWLAFLTKLGVGACLADDMGLGKTVQTLALVQYYRNTGHLRPVLLVCPTSVIENWRMEIERFFPGMSFYVHHGRDRFRGNMFAVTARRSAMVLSSYALIHRDYEEYRGVDWLGVVLDEAQNIKNPDTHQARAARGIKSDWRVVLTGTPVENHVGDIWSIMEFLMPGMLGSRKSFTGRYVKPLAESQDPRLTEGLRKSVSPFIMRRLKTDPDIVPELPRKIETKVFCGLKREQMRLYAKAAEEMSREAEGVEGIRRRGLVLAGITKMKRICDHPDLAERDGGIGVERSSKLERLLSLAEEMHETGDRALIFTQYVDMGHILKYQLQERFGREVLFLHGSVPRSARDGMVRQFQDGFGPQFFVLSLRAGGVGLNLTRANHVVMFDRWWNPAVENQAIDRAYRIGQSSSVQVHIFCCKGTLEERIDKIISSKRALAGSLIWEKDSWITDLSDRELQSLVALSSNALDS